MTESVRYIHTTDVHNTASASVVVPMLLERFKPASVVDVGCGIGTWLSVFRQLGVVDQLGIDGNYVDRGLLAQHLDLSLFLPHDLERPLRLDRRFDLALCLETAEHLSPETVDIFVDNLCALSDVIVFSAALPAQEGQGHIHLRWPEWWAGAFRARGYSAHDLYRTAIWENPSVDWWYQQNLFVLTKNQPAGSALPDQPIRSYIHPEPYVDFARRLENAEARIALASQLVSVIVPAYKAENYLPEALASIAAQSHPHWEVLVIEDAYGKDGTQEIVAAFAERWGSDRVRFLQHRVNRGLAGARNTGIRAARGAYIALLDHDDYWLPDHLSLSLARLSAEEADVCYGTVEIFKQDGQQSGFEFWGPAQADLDSFPASLLSRNFITPSSTVFKRDMMAKAGGFDEDQRMCEDIEYWLRLISEGARFTHLAERSCRYRKHPGAMTQQEHLIAHYHAVALRKYRTLTGVSQGQIRQAQRRLDARAADRLWVAKQRLKAIQYWLRTLLK